MAVETELVGTGEDVIVVVREEVEGMEKGIPPVDMQCAAEVSKGNRHKAEIYWDEGLRLWSSLCEKHTLQNDKARQNEADKVVLFEVGQ